VTPADGCRLSAICLAKETGARLVEAAGHRPTPTLAGWRATDERSAELTYVFQDIDPEPATTAPGTVTVRQSVAVDASGNAFTAPLTVEVQIPDGTVVFSAAYTARGTRLQVEPMPPLGTPPLGTPTA
jgi:hypothetical protein